MFFSTFLNVLIAFLSFIRDEGNKKRVEGRTVVKATVDFHPLPNPTLTATNQAGTTFSLNYRLDLSNSSDDVGSFVPQDGGGYLFLAVIVCSLNGLRIFP